MPDETPAAEGTPDREQIAETIRQAMYRHSHLFDGTLLTDRLAYTLDLAETLAALVVPAGEVDAPPSRDEQIAIVERWGWSRDVSHTAWIPPRTGGDHG